MDGPMFGGEHLGSPVRSPERRGESCIRPLCSIRPYAQKLRLHRAILLSGHFLFFLWSHFHKVLVRYRYRDSLSLSILSGFFDSE
ncbi:MAG: hypothetical protein BECKG1743F_GA0114225_105062 [Candidatus Kentron sp. G]|nr:MAG: hypothetical protein BECKG1743F_GA0114225_105062 [Candidatus Kentron sp. G]